MEFFKLLIQFLSTGTSAAVISLLSMVVAFLLWERKKLIKESDEFTQKLIDAKDKEAESIKHIIERYHQGNLDLIQALNEIKIVLTTITTKTFKN